MPTGTHLSWLLKALLKLVGGLRTRIGISFGGGSACGAGLVLVRVRRNRMKKRLHVGSEIMRRCRQRTRESEDCVHYLVHLHMVCSLDIFSLSPFSVSAVSVLAYLEYRVV
jgi:hypothetical protein